MSAKSHPEDLFTLNSLSRRLDITYARALNLLHRGTLESDFTASGLHLFRKDRLPEIKSMVDRDLNPLANAHL